MIFLGGLRSNELTILTGETASGKTTWAANLGYQLSQENHPVLIASFEMKPLTILKKMIQMETGHPFFDLHKKEIDESLQSYFRRPVYFIDVYGEIGLRSLKMRFIMQGEDMALSLSFWTIFISFLDIRVTRNAKQSIKPSEISNPGPWIFIFISS